MSAPWPEIQNIINDTDIVSTPITHSLQRIVSVRLLRFGRFFVTTLTKGDEPEHLMLFPPANHNTYYNSNATHSNTDLGSGGKAR